MANIMKRPDRPRPWYVSWREPETKAQRWKAFATKREAGAFRDTVSTEIRQGTYTDRRPVPFDTFARDWLARSRPAVSANTGALYEWVVNKYLIPAFGIAPIQSLTAERIERWQAKLLQQAPEVKANLRAIHEKYKTEHAKISEKDGNGTIDAKEITRRLKNLAIQERTEKKKAREKGIPQERSVEICRTVLGTILEDARRKKRIFVNPIEDVRRFDIPKRELRYLDPGQVKELCEKAGRIYGVLFLVMAFCGLRIGEALGLQWGDVNFTRRHLFVQRQVAWRRRKDCKPDESRWEFKKPKSEAGKRVVEIPLPLVPFLALHQEEQNGGPNHLNLIFPSETGTPMEPGNVRRRHFEPALKALGVKGIRLHDFRRTFIALHVEAGTHPKLVQTRVGHSNIRLTMDVYGKAAGDMAMAEEQVTKFNTLVARALPAPA